MKNKYLTIVAGSFYPLTWLALAINAIDQQMPIRTSPETYGSAIFWCILAVLAPTVFFSVIATLLWKDSD